MTSKSVGKNTYEDVNKINAENCVTPDFEGARNNIKSI